VCTQRLTLPQLLFRLTHRETASAAAQAGAAGTSAIRPLLRPRRRRPRSHEGGFNAVDSSPNQASGRIKLAWVLLNAARYMPAEVRPIRNGVRPPWSPPGVDRALRRRDAAAAIDHTVWQFTDAANRLTEMGGRSDPVNPPPRERWSGAIGPPPGDDTAKPVTVSATLGDSPDESSSTDIDTMGLLVSPARIHPTTRAPATGEYAGIEYAALPVMSVAPVRLRACRDVPIRS
jgi:hypothetical protein